MAKSSAEFRRKLIARVDALRVAAGMSKEEFFARTGPVVAKGWTSFVAAHESDAWNHISIETLDRIAAAFEIRAAALVRFKSKPERSPSRHCRTPGL